MLFGRIIQLYRGTWIYQYGSPILLFSFYGGVFLSFMNTIHLISKHKSHFKKNLIWILLGAIPFLYIGIMMVILMIKLLFE